MDPKENGETPALGFASSNGYAPGLTKREHFAAMAMQAMLSDECGGVGQAWPADACANRACLFADALLRALAAGQRGEG